MVTSSAGSSAPMMPAFVNATLTTKKRKKSVSATDDPDIVVNVYLPPGTSSADSDGNFPHFYRSTRFEGGSMIGPIRVTNYQSDHQSAGPEQPWHLQRNCWKFPYNRECVDDIKSPNGGANHGHHDHDDNAADDKRKPRTAPDESHMLYGTDRWRVSPKTGHDPRWPESGVGLASEFGYGGDGASCVSAPLSPCGWISALDSEDDDDKRGRPVTKIVNGVLGYDEAKIGQPFLKIGVGKLVKGSCPACNATHDGADGYHFNSPYDFYEEPVWTVVKERPYHVVMEHEATLGGRGGEDEQNHDHHHHHHHSHGPEYGYRLKKSVHVDGRVLSVTSTLTNLGRDRFATPWYSHHFFTCDGLGVGPAGAYGLDLELRPFTNAATGQVRYRDPPWAAPLARYAEVREVKHVEERQDSWFDFFSPGWWRTKETRKTTQITMTKELDDGVKIKAEFPNDRGRSKGSFVMHGCGVSVAESIPELQDKLHPSGEVQESAMSMYAYNVYIERDTLSPEPVYLIELDGGASISWTQRVEIGLDGAEVAKLSPSSSEAALRSRVDILEGNGMVFYPAVFVALTLAILYSAIKEKWRRRSEGYRQI